MLESKGKYINPFADYGFKRLFKIAEIAKLNKDELRQYQESLNAYRDIKNSVDTAWEEGKLEGKQEGKLEVALKSIKAGIDIATIAKITGLSVEEIELIKKNSNY